MMAKVKLAMLMAGIMACTVVAGGSLVSAQAPDVSIEAAYWEKEARGARTNEGPSSAEYHDSTDYSVYGYLIGSSDDDTFMIRGNGSTATVNVAMAQDIEITIYDQNRNVIAGPIDNNASDDIETWTGTIPDGVDYYVKITGWDNGGSFDPAVENFPYIMTFEN